MPIQMQMTLLEDKRLSSRIKRTKENIGTNSSPLNRLINSEILNGMQTFENFVIIERILICYIFKVVLRISYILNNGAFKVLIETKYLL